MSTVVIFILCEMEYWNHAPHGFTIAYILVASEKYGNLLNPLIGPSIASISFWHITAMDFSSYMHVYDMYSMEYDQLSSGSISVVYMDLLESNGFILLDQLHSPL